VNKKNLMLAVTTALIGMATSAGAQNAYVRPAYQYPATPTGTGPASVQLGETPVYMTPYLAFAAGHDDNLFYSHTNKRSSALYVTSPGLRLDARDANKVFQLSYQGQIGRYAQSENDDYVDQTLRTQFDMAIDPRNFLKLGYDYIRSHDPRGSTDRPIEGSPDKYRLSVPYATYAYGAPGANGRVEVYYSDATRRYLNNRTVTIFADRGTQEYGAAFYARVMPKTYVLVEARETNIHYVQPGSPFSADERRIYGGVSWEATAATTGTIKVGNLKRRFKSDLPNFSGTSWEGLITWAPRTYSKFDFYTARQTNESTGLGSFILSSVSGVAWTHAWSSVLTTGVDVRYQKDEYQDFNRTDETKALGLKVGYRFRRWLTLGAEYTYTKRDSNAPLFEYDKNLYLLTATASM
jgi:hypothetical protein